MNRIGTKWAGTTPSGMTRVRMRRAGIGRIPATGVGASRPWLFVAAALVVGCAAAARPSVSAPQPARPGWSRRAGDVLAEDMRELARRMAHVGLVPGPMEGQGFLASQDRATHRLELPADTCMTVVALASSGIGDLDAVLYAPDGEVLAEDVEPDAHPTVQVCGGAEGRRLYYHLKAYDGAGAYLYAAFLGARSEFGAAARVVGGEPGVAVERVLRPADATRWRELAEGLERRGFSSRRPPEPVSLVPAQPIRLPLPVESGHCYTVVALTAGAPARLALRVLDDVGRDVARAANQPERLSEASLEELATQFCATRSGPFSAELESHGGAAQAALAVFEGPSSEVGGASGLWLGVRSHASVSGTSVQDAGRREAARAAAQGYGESASLATGTLARAEAVAHPIVVQPGRCVRVAVVGGEGMGPLWARLVDAEGTLLAEAPQAVGKAVLRACAKRRRRLQLRVAALGEGGPYRIQQAAKEPPPSLSQAASEARGGLLAALETAEEDGWKPRGKARLEPLPYARQLELSPGRCVRVAAIGAAGERSVSLTLRRSDQVVDAGAGPVAKAFACASEERLELELSVRGPADEAWLLEFTR